MCLNLVLFAAISTNAIRDTHSGAGRRLRSAAEVEAVAAGMRSPAIDYITFSRYP